MVGPGMFHFSKVLSLAEVKAEKSSHNYPLSFSDIYEKVIGLNFERCYCVKLNIATVLDAYI
jgi:hypothetical protein